MKIANVFCVVLSFVMLETASADSIDDVSLKEALRSMLSDVHPVRKDIVHTLEEINFETNRLVSAAKAIYLDSNDECVQGRSISIVSEYGDIEDAVFLENCATNLAHWRSAAVGVLNLLGQTSNSVSRLETLIRNHRSEGENVSRALDRGLVVENLLRRAKCTRVSPSDKAATFAFAINFVSNEVSQVESTDLALVDLDPSYKISRRRLELLRYLQGKATTASQSNYIESAIREFGGKK